MSISRRAFLGASSVAVGAGLPGVFQRAAWAAPKSDQPGGEQTVLVVVELTGGNDGLNTVIPFRDPDYREARPTIRQSAGRSQKNQPTTWGFIPQCKALPTCWRPDNLRLCKAWVMPTPTVRTLNQWTSGTKPHAPKRNNSVGWGDPFLTSNLAKACFLVPAKDLWRCLVPPVMPPRSIR